MPDKLCHAPAVLPRSEVPPVHQPGVFCPRVRLVQPLSPPVGVVPTKPFQPKNLPVARSNLEMRPKVGSPTYKDLPSPQIPRDVVKAPSPVPTVALVPEHQPTMP